MDPQHLADTIKHLDKQDELFREAIDSIKLELSKLRAEERLLMEKFSQLKNPQELIMKSKDGNDNNGSPIG